MFEFKVLNSYLSFVYPYTIWFLSSFPRILKKESLQNILLTVYLYIRFMSRNVFQGITILKLLMLF